MGRTEICMIVFLSIQSWTDVRKREICLPVFGVFLLGGILWRISRGTFWTEGMLSMGTGILMAFLSAVSRGEIGFGDGLLILAMGAVLNVRELAGILCAAFLLCGIYAGIQLLVLKKQRDMEIPFAPFLLAGYLGGVFL